MKFLIDNSKFIQINKLGSTAKKSPTNCQKGHNSFQIWHAKEAILVGGLGIWALPKVLDFSVKHPWMMMLLGQFDTFTSS